MICILCLDDSKEGIYLFSDEGRNLQIVEIIQKHFWIKPNRDDPNCSTTCISCWLKVETFHSFYQAIEEAHKKHFETRDGLLPNLEFALKDDKSSIDGFDNFDDFEDTVDSDDDKTAIIPIVTITENEIKFETAEPTKDPIEDQPPCVDIVEEVETIGRTIWSRRAKQTEGDNAHQACFSDSKSSEDEEPAPKPKRGRPRKTSPPRKALSPSKKPSQKTELSKEYDALIAQHMKLACCICSASLGDFNDLKRHFRVEHKTRGYALCCNKKFLKRGVLVDHINFHLNPDYFKCPECDKVLADKRCLDVHLETHQKKEEQKRIFQCDECPKSFTKNLLLKRHKLTHVPDSAREFKCEDCDKLYPSMYALKSHRNNVHDNTYTKICDICGKTVRSKNALARHLMEHEGIPQPEVQCDKCGLKLTNKYSLKRHTTIMHSDFRKPQTCELCGKVAPNPQALRRHYNYVHQCERQHKCSICSKAFKKATTLREHMTTHTGEVLYTCAHCPKTFNSNANMHSHRKKVHRKEWEEYRRKIRPFAYPEGQSTETVKVEEG